MCPTKLPIRVLTFHIHEHESIPNFRIHGLVPIDCKSGLILHLTAEDDDPGHEDPPFAGAGLLQVLDLFLVPVSVLHEPHEPQDPQLPLTENK